VGAFNRHAVHGRARWGSALQRLTAAALAALAVVLWSGAALPADEKIALSFSQPLGGLALCAAIDQGYFKEEGLDVSAVRLGADAVEEAAASGKIVGGELNYQIYKLASKNIGVTAGLYSGFLLLRGSDPQKAAEIVIASESSASGPAAAAARQLKALGVDTAKAKWTEVPADGLDDALEKGEATLTAIFDRVKPGEKPARGGGGRGRGAPEGAGGHSREKPEAGHGGGGEHGAAKPEGHAAATGAKGEGAHPVVFSARASLPKEDPSAPSANPHSKHSSAHHFFDSFVFVSKDYFQKSPDKAAAITRAWIRGAIWVGENQRAAADLGLKHFLWEGSRESLETEIASFMWMPGVKHAKEHLTVYIHEWTERGIFPAGSDESKIFDSLFLQALPDLN
jgi:hypothetical protein